METITATTEQKLEDSSTSNKKRKSDTENNVLEELLDNDPTVEFAKFDRERNISKLMTATERLMSTCCIHLEKKTSSFLGGTNTDGALEYCLHRLEQYARLESLHHNLVHFGSLNKQ